MFTAESLHEQLLAQPGPQAWQVAYSGGLDSTVLLHALVTLRDRLPAPLGAVHVHHGLQPAADAWTGHCQAFCETHAIPLAILRVDARPQHGESPEAAAREARYAAIAGWLAAGHCLLTAQHLDDQAETLLLQLLRGAGVHGMAGMPHCTALGRGTHMRPLLGVARADLSRYAQQHGLQWVEDPTNAETGLDRNFLRHAVLPVVQQRWPAAAASLGRSAGHHAEAAGLLDELARADVAAAAGRQGDTLSVAVLATLPGARQRNVLRFWLRQLAGRAPSTAVLARIQDDVLGSRADAEPRVQWGAHEVRRYRDDVYLLAISPQDRDTEYRWQPDAPLTLPGGVLSASHSTGEGLRQAAIGASGMRVRWRRGGETCRPAGRGHRHALKKLFQEAGIPPWQRARIPLLYIDDQLAAVAGLWICEPFQAAAGEPAWRLCWEPEEQSSRARFD